LRACNLYFLGPGLDGETVGRQFDAVNAVERAPEHVVVAAVLDKELVDAIGYTLRTVDDNALVYKRACGLVSRGTANLVVPVAAPYANGSVENILTVNEVNVGRPHHSPRRQVLRTCGIGEGCARLGPLYKVLATENRHVADILGAVEIEESVGSLDDRRIRNAEAYDRIVVGLLLRRIGICASSVPRVGRNGGTAAAGAAR